MMILNPYRFGSVSYDPDTAAYLAQLPTDPTADFKAQVNNYVVSLKGGSNNFGKLDRLVPFNSQYQANALTSIPNPTSTPNQEVSAPTWTRYNGYLSNGGYIRTHFTPSTDATFFQKDDACFFIWSNTNESITNHCDFGANNTVSGTGILGFLNDVGSTFGAINDSSGGVSISSVPNSLGLFSFVRTSSTTISVYKNGTLLGSASRNSTLIADLEIYILGLNSNNTFTLGSSKQIALWGCGAGSINQIELYNSTLGFINGVAALPAPPVPPISNSILKLAIPALTDSSGNGWDSTLGASLPSGFTAPTIDGANNLVFSGSQTVKLNTSFGVTALTQQTVFMAFYCDTPESTSSLFNIGTTFVCGMRQAVFDRGNNRYANSGGVFVDEGPTTEPIYGRSLPKLQKGYNVVGISFSTTQVIIYCNGIVSYWTTNPGSSPGGTSGWLGGFLSPYSMDANMKMLSTATYGTYFEVFNYTATISQMKTKGDSMVTSAGLSSLVFVGDSITQGVTLPTNAQNWPAIVSDYLITNTAYKWTTVNIGIGSRFLQNMATSIQNNVTTVPFNVTGSVTIDTIQPSQAVGAKNHLVLLAGINDLANGRTLVQIQSDFTSFINGAKSIGFTKIHVLSVTSDVGLTGGQEADRLSYNTWLAGQASVQGFYFIDTCNSIAGANTQPMSAPLTSDGVHYTALMCSDVAPLVYNNIIANI